MSVDGVPAEEHKLIRKNLSDAIGQRESLRKLRDWWNKINTAFRVNEIGFALGYVYAQQEVEDFPEWL